MTTLHFLIPRGLLLTQNQRLHRMQVAQRVKALRVVGAAAVDAPAATPCALDVLVGWPDKRRRDRINVSPTVKALVDGMVAAGLLPDDSDDVIRSETYRSHIAREKGLVRLDLTFTPVREDA